MPHIYRDFEITVGPRGAEGYHLVAECLRLDAEGAFVPPEDEEFRTLLARVEDLTADRAATERLGERLFAALFQGQVLGLYHRSRGALPPTERLRLVLKIGAERHEVARLPWEFLRDPESGALARSDVPVVRCVPLGEPVNEPSARLPLRVLLSAAQTDPPAPVERELAWVAQELGALGGQVEVVVEPHLTARILQHRLRERFHVWHFVGHGGASQGGPCLMLEAEGGDGEAEPLDDAELQSLVAGSDVRLVVLNACGSGSVGQDPLRSLAPALIRARAPVVVAMQFQVPAESARAFARAFYGAVAAGLPVDACAIEGRRAVLTGSSGGPDWGIPVVYSRAPAVAIVQPRPRCPYPGMAPFRAEDERLFFGREEEIDQMTRQLRFRRELWVGGRSGVGKSSLVRAGLLPRLADVGDLPLGAWHTLELRPGPRQSREALIALAEHPAGPEAAVAELLAAQASKQRLLLFIDQFEELFTVADAEERRRFIAAIRALRGVPACTLVMAMRSDAQAELCDTELWQVAEARWLEIGPLRGDALARAIARPAEAVGVTVEPDLLQRLLADAAAEPGALPLVQSTMVLLWPKMEQRRLTLAHYEDLGDEGRSGLATAIRVTAEETYKDLSEEQRPIARRIFLRLVQFGEGRADTRRQQPLDRLRAAGDDPAIFELTLRKLEESGLITVTNAERRTLNAERRTPHAEPHSNAERRTLNAEVGDAAMAVSSVNAVPAPDSRAATSDAAADVQTSDPQPSAFSLQPSAFVDIAHEALIGAWPRLQEWLREYGAAELTRRALEVKARDWVGLGGSEAGLLDAGELTQAQGWLNSGTRVALGVSEHLEALIQRSQEALARQLAEQEQRLRDAAALDAARKEALANREQRIRLQRWGLLAVSVLAVAAAAAALLAVQQRNEAHTQRELAEQRERVAQAVALAAQARVAAAQFPRVGVLLAVEAVTTTVRAGQPAAPEAEQALRDTLALVHDRVLLGHQGAVEAASYSPDNRWVLTHGADGSVRLWDSLAPDPSATARVLWGHGAPATAFAVSSDGRHALAGGQDGTARLWDLWGAAPTTPLHDLRAHQAPITAVAFGPDGRTVLTADASGFARLWDLTASDPGATARVLRGHQGPITAVAFSRNGQLALTGDASGMARLWRLRAGDISAGAVELRGHQGPITVVAFSPNSRWALTSSDDRTARLWDTHADNPASGARLLRGHTGAITAAALSPDGRWVLTGSDDNTARLWSMSDADPSRSARVLRGHEGDVTAVAFSPDGRHALTGGVDGTIRLWDVQAAGPAATARVLYGHEGPVTTVGFSPDGDQVLSSSQDGTARLWDAHAFDVPRTVRVLHTGGDVQAMAFSRDGLWALTSGEQGAALLWDLQAPGRPAVVRTLHGHSAEIRTIAFSSDGRLALTGADDATARLWTLAAPDPEAAVRVLVGHEGRIHSVALSPDGRRALSGGDDGILRLWDVTASDPAATVRLLRGHRGLITAVAFSPDGRFAMSGGGDGTARIWDLQAPDPEATVRVLKSQAGLVQAVAFSPDGRFAFTAGSDRTARLWDLTAADPAASARTLRGHTGSVEAGIFSLDGRYLLTGSEDTTARLWDLQAADPSASVRTLRGHALEVEALWFSPDGRRVLTGSEDGTARIWNVDVADLLAQACQGAGRNLTLDEWRQYRGAAPYRVTCAGVPPDPAAVAELAQAGRVADALALYEGAQRAPAYLVSAALWDAFCRAGWMGGRAGELLDACDRAVAQAPASGAYRDSRAVARALVGDLRGASEDVRAAIAWLRRNDTEASREAVARRERWAAALAAGRNPFDATVLRELREER
ncbi:MAG TPA: CHAT domain-containing protein [Roseiflexaceae bacterium]|nr:CHAT domain-containing protein [Roseiflexaceae bacterium]